MPPPAPPPLPGHALQYGRPEPSRFRVVDYLLQCLTAGVFVGIVVGTLTFAGRFRQMFADFNMKLPAATQFVLDVQWWFSASYGAVWVWGIVPVVPLLLGLVKKELRLRVALLAVVLVIALLALIFAAIFLPLLSLMQALGGGK